MPDPLHPWSCLPLETWERLLAVVLIEDDFDPVEVGAAAGLSSLEIEALKAWCRHTVAEDRARRRAGASPSENAAFLDFLEGLRSEVDPAKSARLDAEIAALRARKPPVSE